MEKTGPKLSPEQQFQILSQGVVDIISEKELMDKLKLKRALRVKAGFDPSKPDIHLGHAILINKLCQFQSAGHEVIFVVGDWTACVGDPSGQNKTRPLLSFAEAKKNSLSYAQQAMGVNFKAPKTLDERGRQIFSFFKKLDPKKTKWVYNSEWIDKISLRKFIISMCSKLTVARQLERKDFSSRYKAGRPIALHEFLYPLLQAYDSVHLKADVEIGGSDQLFNLLLGRSLQEQQGQKPQVALSLPLLEGTDGQQKMSKSLNNAISFNDPPKDIYGKVMKISDQLLSRYIHLFTEGKTNLQELFQSGKLFPKQEKEKLAYLLVCAFYSEAKADEVQREWRKVFSERGLPDHIPKKNIPPVKNVGICQLLKEVGLFPSASSARRGIEAGAVRKNGQKLTDFQEKLNLGPGAEFLLSFGKRKIVRVKVK